MEKFSQTIGNSQLYNLISHVRNVSYYQVQTTGESSEGTKVIVIEQQIEDGG